MKIAIYFWNRLLPTEYRVIRADFELKSKACSVRNTQLSSKYLKTAKDWGKMQFFFENQNIDQELSNACFHAPFGRIVLKKLAFEWKYYFFEFVLYFKSRVDSNMCILWDFTIF